MGRVLAFGAVAAALSGCGTVQNFQRGSIVDATVYGGVDIAANRLKTSPLDGNETAVQGECDVVLSAVGDTATLPITVTAEVIRAIRAAYCTPPNTQPSPKRPPPLPPPDAPASPPLPPPATSAAPPQPGTSTAPPPHGPPPAP